MEQEILVSVIVPCYNIEDCLVRCVDSIRRQTLRELEILLVDDGSTDGTGRLCDSFAAMDGRIRVFHKENGGSSSARNLGIDSARGQWLGFVDSDDWIEPEMYERLLETARLYKTDIAQASRDEIGEDGQRRPDVCRAPDRVTVWEAEPFLRELLLHRGDCSFCTKLVRRELFADRRFPEGKLNEDFFLLVGMLAEDHAICVLPQQMYHVFYRVGSNTRKRDPEEFSRVFEDIVENADFAEKLAAQKYPHLAGGGAVCADPAVGLSAAHSREPDDRIGSVLYAGEAVSAIPSSGDADQPLSDGEKQGLSAASDPGPPDGAPGARGEDAQTGYRKERDSHTVIGQKKTGVRGRRSFEIGYFSGLAPAFSCSFSTFFFSQPFFFSGTGRLPRRPFTLVR